MMAVGHFGESTAGSALLLALTSLGQTGVSNRAGMAVQLLHPELSGCRKCR